MGQKGTRSGRRGIKTFHISFIVPGASPVRFAQAGRAPWETSGKRSIFPILPGAFPGRAFQCGIHSAAANVNDAPDNFVQGICSFSHHFAAIHQVAPYFSIKSSIVQPRTLARRRSVSALALLMSLLRCSYIWMERRLTPDRFASSACVQP